MTEIPVFLISDQPTTCPMCGNRTEFFPDILNSKLQLHFCLSLECDFIFIIEEE